MSRRATSTSPVSILVLILSIVIIVSLVRSALEFYSAHDRLKATQSQVAELETKKKALEGKLTAIDDSSAVDLGIRDKLNLTLPGETMVVIPPASISGILKPSPAPTPRLSPSRQWLNLFLHPE